MVRTPSAFNILTSKCASRHNGVHFFNISTAKSGPELVILCILTSNVLRATTACTFSTSQLPKVLRPWCVLYILTSKCASCHNGVHFFNISTGKSGPELVILCILTSKCASRHNSVQFFISHLASWLCTRRFSEPTFRPSGAPNHWKNTLFRDFPTFSRICIFFLLTLLSSNLSLLSASSLLCFSSVHIVGSLTSKLASIMLLSPFQFNPSIPPILHGFLGEFSSSHPRSKRQVSEGVPWLNGKIGRNRRAS